MRYIFGSYEPYREVSARLPTEVEDHDRSYAPVDDFDELYDDGYDDIYDEFYGYLPVDGTELDRPADDPVYEGGYVASDDVDHADGYGVDGSGSARVAAMRSEPFTPRVRADVPADQVEADRSRTRPGRAAEPAAVRRFPTPVTTADPSAPPGARRGGGAAGRTALHRRRRIFLVLSAAMLGTLTGVVFLRSPEAWTAHGVAVVLLASYIVLLVVHHQRIEEQTHKVRELEISRGHAARTQRAVIGHGAEVAR